MSSRANISRRVHEGYYQPSHSLPPSDSSDQPFSPPRMPSSEDGPQDASSQVSSAYPSEAYITPSAIPSALPDIPDTSRPTSQFSADDPNTYPFLPPDRPFIGRSIASTPTPRGSAAYYDQSPASASNNNVPLLKSGGAAADEGAFSKEAFSVGLGTSYPGKASKPWYKRPLTWVLAALAVAVIVLAVALPLSLIKHNNNTSTSGSVSNPNGNDNGGNGNSTNTNSTDSAGGGTKQATTGGDGSLITMDDGTTFTYHNPFGGFWVSDPANPFDNSARPNSWTPPLNTSWTWGQDRIYGVNLGGLFVLEPFITPSLYETHPGAVDEWTLSTILNASGNLTGVLEDHYNTFITEQDIAEIAGAGLNWIRLPIPFWAIDAWSNVGVDGSGNVVSEPFLAKVCWKYVLRVFGWARKYGLRVNLDLHTAPGSQNGFNHSGKLGPINFLNGPMGIANAQRMLDYIRVITEFISQPEYKDVIPMFGVINEALVGTIGMSPITSFYLQAHDTVRSVTGIGSGNGPFISIHDGFSGPARWSGFLQNSDRIALDQHPYFAFDGQPNNEPVDVLADGGDGKTMYGGQWPKQACQSWGPGLNSSRQNFGVSFAGEFSNAINDCGLFINGVGGHAGSAADCNLYSDASGWSANMKNGMMNFAMASMDSLGDWFFWTWKIGNSSTTGTVNAPLWSYKLGLENGWMPTDPRQAIGLCASLGVTGTPFSGTFQPWQTGGAGAGSIPASSSSQFSFPPTSMAGVPVGSITALPTYTATASIETLPPPSFVATTTASGASVSVSVGNGWFDVGDTKGMVTAVSGCTYPNAWSAVNSPIPTACGGTGVNAVASTSVTAGVVTSDTAVNAAPLTVVPAAAATAATVRR